MQAIYLLITLFISVVSTTTEEGIEPVRFQIKNAGITVDGTISDWEYEIVWDAKKLSSCKISGHANPRSIDTGIKLRDNHLMGRQYFNVEKFPVITLQSKKFISHGKGKYTGTFELQIKDVIKEIDIPCTVSRSNNQQQFKAEFIINRLDFKLGESSIVLSDEVKVVLAFTN